MSGEVFKPDEDILIHMDEEEDDPEEMHRNTEAMLEEFLEQCLAEENEQ